MDQRKAEQSSGLERDELTPRLSWSAYSLRTEWNRAKGVVAPWWGENSKGTTRPVWPTWRPR
jgi:putative transposase